MCANYLRWLVAISVVLWWGHAHAQISEDSFRVYAVRIQKTLPFGNPSTGYGIYLGKGWVISAAHVVGRWPLFTNPHVLVDGHALPAAVIKMGSSEGIDVTLLHVDENRLPIRMRLRRNPLCKSLPVPGEEVFGVIPDKVVRSHILSPEYIPEELRKTYNTLTADVITLSGSGIFRVRTKCLLGIASKSVPRFRQVGSPPNVIQVREGVAGYFVPATQILEFLAGDYTP